MKKPPVPEAWIADVVSHVADAIIATNDAQEIIFFNAGAETIFGYTPKEVMGRTLDVLLPPRFRLRHRRLVERFAEGPETSRRMGERQRIAGMRKGGEEFAAEATITRLTLGKGKHILTVILRDVSEQQRREDEQRFLLHAGELLSSTSLDYDQTLSRVVQLATESLADWCLFYLGEPPEVRLVEAAHREASQKELAASMRGFKLDGSKPYFARQTIEGGQPVLVPHVSPDAFLPTVAQSEEHLHLLQQVAPRSYMGTPLVLNHRTLGALMFISTDSGRSFTPQDLRFAMQLGRLASLALENARLYRSALQATEARDAVLRIVAHDLRNPLSSILLVTRLMHHKGKHPEEQFLAENLEKWRTNIDASAQRMNRLIEDLLEVSRLQAGHPLAINKAVQATGALLKDAFEMCLPHAGAISLELDAPEGLPSVLGDRERLLQVFSNLVGNALKFTPAGKTVRLGARRAGGFVEFFVADTGPGLPAEAHEHLFESFWQGHRNDRRGVGLGLSIVKGVVEAHGGHVRVESEPGQGATFFFTVPVADGS